MTELRNVEADLSRFRARVLVASVVVVLAFLLLAARLVYLQVVRHADLDEQAENNRTAVVPIVPNRGLILDRNGIVLATNYSAYTLEITPSRLGRDLDATIDDLAKVIDIQQRDRRRFRKLLDESKSFESLPIRTRLTDEEVARFAAQRFRFPGVEIKARLFRNYPWGELASHVIGYIGRINQTEKKSMEDWSEEEQGNYRGTEYIGKLGVEQSFEKQLHGTTGVEQVETSAGGRAVRKLASHPATPGNTVQLSIDIKLQKLVEDMFGERRGALVAIDPKTGEVLAFVSKPTFDPNLFVDGIDSEKLADAQRVHRQASAEPGAARHLPAGFDLQAVHGAGGAADRQAFGQHHHQRRRLLELWWPCVPQPRRPRAGPRGHAPEHRQVKQRVLLLAGQRAGRGHDARLHEATGFRAVHGHRHPGRGARRAAQPGLEAQLLQAARAEKVVRRRDHRWASARATTASPCCSWHRPRPPWPTMASALQTPPGDCDAGRHDAQPHPAVPSRPVCRPGLQARACGRGARGAWWA
jgi:hypothetical protein